MASRILVGLSGPTFFDYQHAARKTKNDLGSSPNPILENALGLAVFYDEVWFFCESLCPQTLRGHHKIRYLDKYLNHPGRGGIASRVTSCLTEPISIGSVAANRACTNNFKDYWKRVQNAGAYWWNQSGTRIDNHSHGLEIVGVPAGANSNSTVTLGKDISVCQALKATIDLDLSLNSFTRNIYNTVYPNQFDRLVESSDHAMCGSAVINALVPNCITRYGPQPEVFDKVSNSRYASEFRRYVQSKQIKSAHECYLDLTDEIESAIGHEVKKAADRLHPTRGIASIAIDAVHEMLGTSLMGKFACWYGSVVSPRPVSAAAFILDVTGSGEK